MFDKNFPLAFVHDVPQRGCKPVIEGAIHLHRYAFLGSNSAFCFLNQHFSLENLEDLETLISPLHGDNSQWELSSWPPFNGSCVSYSYFSCIFFYQPPLFIYIICLSSLGTGLCKSLLCRDCPSHPSLPIQILVTIHDSSQVSTDLFPKNCL